MGFTLRAVVCALVALVVVAPPAALEGQRQNGPVGLLLGLRIGSSSDDPAERASKPETDPGTMAPPRYRTLWIVKDAGRVGLAASADLLVVPRGEGFWRIGSDDVELSDTYREEMLWVSASTNTPVVDADDRDAGRCRGRSFAQVEFVAGDYLAYAGGSLSNCGDKDNEWFNSYLTPMASRRDRRFGVDGGYVPIGDVFGTAGLPALRRVGRSLARRVVADMKADDPFCCERDFERGLASLDDTAWGVRRHRARLDVFGYINVWRNDYAFASVPLTPPPSSLGWHSSELDWDAVQRAVPDAADAFRSPRGDLLVVVTPKRVVAFTPVSRRALGKPVLEIAVGDDDKWEGEPTWWGTRQGTAAVMAEWAAAPFVSKWGAAVTELARIPHPRVLPGPSAP